MCLRSRLIIENKDYSWNENKKSPLSVIFRVILAICAPFLVKLRADEQALGAMPRTEIVLYHIVGIFSSTFMRKSRSLSTRLLDTSRSRIFEMLDPIFEVYFQSSGLTGVSVRVIKWAVFCT